MDGISLSTAKCNCDLPIDSVSSSPPCTRKESTNRAPLTTCQWVHPLAAEKMQERCTDEAWTLHRSLEGAREEVPSKSARWYRESIKTPRRKPIRMLGRGVQHECRHSLPTMCWASVDKRAWPALRPAPHRLTTPRHHRFIVGVGSGAAASRGYACRTACRGVSSGVGAACPGARRLLRRYRR